MTHGLTRQVIPSLLLPLVVSFAVGRYAFLAPIRAARLRLRVAVEGGERLFGLALSADLGSDRRT